MNSVLVADSCIFIIFAILNDYLMNKAIIIIPARYASSRFPGKPLALLGGKPVIQHVVEQAKKVSARVVVATDDERIKSCVLSFGGECVLTSGEHHSGTDRAIEAFNKIGQGEDIVINLQGDEPFILPEQIEALLRAFDDEQTQIATLAEAYSADTPDAEVSNPNNVKLVRTPQGGALYFSRSLIPYPRGVDRDYCKHHQYYKHIGLYAFRAQILPQLAALPQSVLEQTESLEQLRWLEAGYRIRVMDTERSTIGIDTPSDLALAEDFLKTRT